MRWLIPTLILYCKLCIKLRLATIGEGFVKIETSSEKLINIALNRFGLGALNKQQRQQIKSVKNWVVMQLTPIEFSSDVPTAYEILSQLEQNNKEKKKLKAKNQSESKMAKQYPANIYRKLSTSYLKQAISSEHSINWRLLDFFSNHFSLSASGKRMRALAPTLEREAIAPHLLGNFGDMLLAVSQHPAMLLYLNNEVSFGENSRIGQKRKKGLNENLAREILELHTLGVDGGYTQKDVTELAKGLTGWSVTRPSKEKTGKAFSYRHQGHEPGTRVLMGQKYNQSGVEQAQSMLENLAINPNTAKFICHKLAHHFVSEAPSDELLNAMEHTWSESGGNIKQVMTTLFQHDHAWLAEPQKYKTPREFFISTMRATSFIPKKDTQLVNSLKTLGQQPFNAGSPAGFSDAQLDWLAPSALLARIEWVAYLTSFKKNENAEKLIGNIFGNALSDRTYKSVLRAESRQQALQLLLLSPEFLWR